MIRFAGRGILLDIEGTTSSISFVYDVLFPYARRQLAEFLRGHWTDADVTAACERIARDAGAASLAAWCSGSPTPAEAQARIIAEVNRLMDADVKATGLKELQGLIWREGFVAGVLRAQVFPDVPPALRAWTAAAIDVRIFSSGSVAAQRLFFKHTEAGDLSIYLRGYYDTTLGPKRLPASYAAIAAEFGLPPADILFVSDVTAELDAARTTGMQIALAVRPGNSPPSQDHTHPCVTQFGEILTEWA